MKVVYIPKGEWAFTFQLASILPLPIERGRRKVGVIRRFFFDDNTYVVRKGNKTEDWLNKLSWGIWVG